MTTADFPNYADDNAGATAASIREAADAPNSHTATINALVNDLANDRQNVQSAIEGDVADIASANPQAAGQTAQNLARNGYYAIGLINQFADAVETYDSTIDTLNEELHDNTYTRFHAQNTSTSDNSEAGSGAEDGEDRLSYDEIKAQEKAKLQGRFNNAVSTLDTAEGTAVTGFQAGPPSAEDVKSLVLAGYIPLGAATLWPGLNLTTDEQRQALGNMAAEEQAEYVRTHPDVPPEVATVISPAAQEALADDVANDFKNEDIDQETVRLMNLFKDQQPFAHGLYSQVTTDEVAAAIKSVNDHAFPGGQVVNRNDPEDVQFYKDFLSAAGATFATYTKGTGDYAPPSNLTDTWFDAITTDDKGESASLSLLIRAGGHATSMDSDFLSDLTSRVYEWERDQSGPVWGPRNDNDIVNPFLTDLGDSTYDGQYVYAADGLANLLGAMEHTPEAAHDFFAAGYPDGDTSETNSRLEYLLGDRTFSVDRSSDEGDGLGIALEAAAAGNRESTPEWSAAFASDVFNRVADLSGSGDAGYNPLDDSWHIYTGMADSLGNIGASYSDDVYDIVAGSPNPSSGHLQIDLADMDKVLGEIGRGDKDGIETLSAAIAMEGNERLQDAISEWQQQHPGEPIDLESVTAGSLGEALRGRNGTNGEVLGHIINQAITVDEQDKDLAETRAAYASKALDIAGGFIPGAGTVLGEGASSLAESAYDVGKSEGLDLLKKAVESTGSATGDDYVRDQRSSLSDALESQTVSQLIRSGVLPIGDGPNQIPESLTSLGPDGRRVLNPDLFDADGPDQIGEDGDYTSEQLQRMREDLYRWSNSNGASYVESITQPGQDGLDRELNKG